VRAHVWAMAEGWNVVKRPTAQPVGAVHATPAEVDAVVDGDMAALERLFAERPGPRLPCDWKPNLGGRVETWTVSLLWIACHRGQVHVARWLAERDHDRDWASTLSRAHVCESHTHYGMSPFFIACTYGHLEVVQWLAECGADVEEACRIHSTTYTPFHAACVGGNLDVARWLAEERGVEIERANEEGRTPFGTATTLLPPPHVGGRPTRGQEVLNVRRKCLAAWLQVLLARRAVASLERALATEIVAAVDHRARSHCRFVLPTHPPHTRFPNIIGASVSAATMRPNPRSTAAAWTWGSCRRFSSRRRPTSPWTTPGPSTRFILLKDRTAAATRGTSGRTWRCCSARSSSASVRARPGRLSALSASHRKIGFVWGFCMGAQGA
jgi:hypothetical protein